MRAPQLGRVTKPKDHGLPPGPNPAASKGLRVEPFANIFALIEGLCVISLHPTQAEADAALAARRKPQEAKAGDQHGPS